MYKFSPRARAVLQHPLRFSVQVIGHFRANQGFLLAGALAYYTLLSLVPVTVVILVLLSTIYQSAALLATLNDYVVLVAPGRSAEVMEQIRLFLENRHLVGWMGLFSLLLFSSFAFSVLETIMISIFAHRKQEYRRPLAISLIIPYVYILLLAAGLLLVTALGSAIQALVDTGLHLFGRDWSLSSAQGVYFAAMMVGGEIFMFSSFYLVMPVGRTAWRHAMIGGGTATLLWELTRKILVWYFSSWSPVNIVYGTFATTVVILLSLEIAAIILLMGAQVIADYEQLP